MESVRVRPGWIKGTFDGESFEVKYSLKSILVREEEEVGRGVEFWGARRARLEVVLLSLSSSSDARLEVWARRRIFRILF